MRKFWERLAQSAEPLIQRLPPVRKKLESEYAEVEALAHEQIHKAVADIPHFSELPNIGVEEPQILEWLERLHEREKPTWSHGRVSGTVYHGGEEHSAFLSRVYALYAQSNPLHADLFPSTVHFESEIVKMTARLLNGDPGHSAPDQQVVGTVTSGGTESILLAMKAYRDWARAEKGITEPEVVAPETAHPAFDKAGHLLCIKVVRTPVRDDFKADVEAMHRAITRRTIALVASAGTFPHGAIDPIPQIAQLAHEYRLGMHVDGCLGGFILPFIEALGYPVTPFDFRVQGVTSISVDPHKYGYTPKGVSVVLYRGRTLRRYQYFTATEWPGGLYASPTLPGSRPGALSVGAWAAMVRIGRTGYQEMARRIMETALHLRKGIEAIPDLRLMGEPLFLIAFTTDRYNIYQIWEQMAQRGWRLNALQKPPGVHLAVTVRHTQSGVAEQFLYDLHEAVQFVKANPKAEGKLAPIYGMANSLPFRGVIDEVLRHYLDALYD